MTQYQRRMTRFVWAGNIYGIAAPIGLWWYEAPGTSWFVFASTVTILYCLATGCDAVYDSLVLLC